MNLFSLKLLLIPILVLSPLALLLIEKLTKKKYITAKNISEDVIKADEIEALVLAVLSSWNQSKLYQNSQFYSKNLLKKQDKHIVYNDMYGKKESIFDIQIEGINNLHQFKNKITAEISLKAKYSLSFDENDSLMYLVTSRSMSRYNEMLKDSLPDRQTYQKDVQKWEFVIEENLFKVNKFSSNLK